MHVRQRYDVRISLGTYSVLVVADGEPWLEDRPATRVQGVELV